MFVKNTTDEVIPIRLKGVVKIQPIWIHLKPDQTKELDISAYTIKANGLTIVDKPEAVESEIQKKKIETKIIKKPVKKSKKSD